MDLVDIARAHPGAIKKLVDHFDAAFPKGVPIGPSRLASEQGRLEIAAFEGKRELIEQLREAWNRVKDKATTLEAD